jgi:hypothetical protein
MKPRRFSWSLRYIPGKLDDAGNLSRICCWASPAKHSGIPILAKGRGNPIGGILLPKHKSSSLSQRHMFTGRITSSKYKTLAPYSRHGYMINIHIDTDTSEPRPPHFIWDQQKCPYHQRLHTSGLSRINYWHWPVSTIVFRDIEHRKPILRLHHNQHNDPACIDAEPTQ